MRKKFNRFLLQRSLFACYAKIFFVGVFILLQTEILAQQKTVTGIVRDRDQNPIAGVTVMLKGTTIGTTTDVSGKYSLGVPETGGTLVFTFIGMEPKEVAITAGNSFDVVLGETTVGLEEVVVVGYGTQKKESVVGAITQVQSEALVKANIATVSNAITGKLSGVFTNQRSGEPGASDAEIVVRGLSSWNGSSPLILVDGVQRDLNALDPNEIETISVLKDASATAVFGARGANGVIIVTTKRGFLNKPKLEFFTSYGVSRVAAIPPFIDAYSTMSMLNVAYKNTLMFNVLTPDNVLEEYRNPSTPLNAIRYPNVNWWDICTKPYSPTYNANFSVRGGTNFAKYYLMLGYLYEGTFFKQYYNKEQQIDTRYWFKRFNYRANVDFSLTKTTTLSFNLGGETGTKNQPGNTEWKTLYGSSGCHFPAYFPSWVLDLVPDPDYPEDKSDRLANQLNENEANPYTSRMQGSFNRYVDSKLYTDMFLNQKFDFILKGLSFLGKVSFSTYYNALDLTSSYTFPDYYIDWTLVGTDKNPWFRSSQSSEKWKMPPVRVSVGDLQSGFYTDLYYEGSLNYQNSFGKHNVSGLILAHRQQLNSGTSYPYYNEAYVARATYDYSRKYLFEFNAGYTGSERFAPGNRYGFFPSVAIGWVVSEERFFRNALPWMNRLKFRYSDGLVGSDAASSRWLYVSEYTVSGNYIYEGSGANRLAQWEEARKKDLGVEIGLFRDLITLSVDLFDEQRSKMLVSPVVTMLVGNTYKDVNIGKVKKHGIEVELQFNKTTAGGLNYFVKGIAGFNENRIIVRNDAPGTPEYKKAAGKSIGANTSGAEFLDDHFLKTVDQIHTTLTPIEYSRLVIGDYKFIDFDANGALTSTDSYPVKGNLYPPFTGSISGGISYKNLSFSFLFSGALGKWVSVSNYFEDAFNNNNYKVHLTSTDYWSPTNLDGTRQAPYIYGNAQFKTQWHSASYIENSWENSDYLRLKEVNLSYDIKNTGALKKILGINGMQVFLTGYNLLVFTNLRREVDPESMTTQNYTTGWYPQTYNIKAGLRLSF